MRFALFYHSLVSDWNHGNAHFLRGIVSELQALGHEVSVFEPADGWSLQNLIQERGPKAIHDFQQHFPHLASEFYDLETVDLEELLDGVDVVIAHEWNEPELISRLGKLRKRKGDMRLLFHDTHHRAVTEPREMAQFDLKHFDGALVFGDILRDIYRQKGWCERSWTWHEAADTRIFKPRKASARRREDLVWIGNWGDEERSEELHQFLLKPAAAAGLSGSIHGVRYPAEALSALDDAGLNYQGWIANYRAPQAFANARFTVHVPRRPYVVALPGIPTIRPFEAMACGIPLISCLWEDAEGLFKEGRDYLRVKNGKEARAAMEAIINDDELAAALSRNGRKTILRRHSCRHRAEELLAVCAEIGVDTEVALPKTVASRSVASA